MTEDELFNLIYYGDVNDPAVVKRVATARITKAMEERLRRRVIAELRRDRDRAVLNREIAEQEREQLAERGE
jgi:hypothetical protein